MPCIFLLILIDLDVLKPKMTSISLHHVRFSGKLVKVKRKDISLRWKMP